MCKLTNTRYFAILQWSQLSKRLSDMSDFALVCDLSFEMMPKVKANKISKIQSILQEFPEEFMKSPNHELYCNWCSRTVSCIQRFLVESH